ncbi:hypothetical protein HDU97_007924 [Phlyctochytrium planicorne]|nr:hypothetical protein HDU97_007924 [Phlyctochytrium planicorne]
MKVTMKASGCLTMLLACSSNALSLDILRRDLTISDTLVLAAKAGACFQTTTSGNKFVYLLKCDATNALQQFHFAPTGDTFDNDDGTRDYAFNIVSQDATQCLTLPSRPGSPITTVPCALPSTNVNTVFRLMIQSDNADYYRIVNPKTSFCLGGSLGSALYGWYCYPPDATQLYSIPSTVLKQISGSGDAEEPPVTTDISTSSSVASTSMSTTTKSTSTSTTRTVTTSSSTSSTASSTSSPSTTSSKTSTSTSSTSSISTTSSSTSTKTTSSTASSSISSSITSSTFSTSSTSSSSSTSSTTSSTLMTSSTKSSTTTSTTSSTKSSTTTSSTTSSKSTTTISTSSLSSTSSTSSSTTTTKPTTTTTTSSITTSTTTTTKPTTTSTTTTSKTTSTSTSTSTTTTQSPSPSPVVPPFPYTQIVAKINSYCWGATSSSAINLVPCNPSDPAQLWANRGGFWVIRSPSVLCATLSGTGSMVLAKCGDGDASQLIIPTADGRIAVGTKCLQVSGTGIKAGTCAGAINESFTYTNKDSMVPSATARGEGASCSRQNYRKEWRDMSTQEKKTYIKAVQWLRQLASNAGRRSAYDDVVAIHRAASTYIHSTAMFLPWHRLFLEMYENMLRQYDASISLPYWDWSSDFRYPMRDSPDIGNVFNPGSEAGIGTRSSSSTGNCVRDGFPAYWTAAGGNCLKREYTDDFDVPSASEVSILVLVPQRFSDMADQLENFHNHIHGSVGGTTGDMTYVNLSPGDPVFFFHHTNVDRLWRLWQTSNPSQELEFNGRGPFPLKGTVDLKGSDLMPSFNVPISTILPMERDSHCTVYLKRGEQVPKTRRSMDSLSMKKRRTFVNDIILPWLNPNLSKKLAANLRKIRIGSGNYGTVKLDPLSPTSEDFFRANYENMVEQNASLNSTMAPPMQFESYDEYISKYRRLEDNMKSMQDDFEGKVDEYYAAHPEVDPTDAYQEAASYALSKVQWRS